MFESSYCVEFPDPTFDAIRDIRLLHLVQKHVVQLTRRFRGLHARLHNETNEIRQTYHRPMKIGLAPLGRIRQERELRHAENLARNVLDARLPHCPARIRKGAQRKSVVSQNGQLGG